MTEPKMVPMTEADAERLGLLARYVTRRTEGEVMARLEEKIASARVVDPNEIPPDVVTMNSQVRLTDPLTGESSIYTVVFPSAVDARKNRISVLGPLGMALLGARVGDEVEYESSVRREVRQVMEILYQPEAAGDLYG